MSLLVANNSWNVRRTLFTCCKLVLTVIMTTAKCSISHLTLDKHQPGWPVSRLPGRALSGRAGF